ncbi:MAG TPA: hypothetical protein VNH22_17460 [Blastocatellia bacterium]|nr:hypothetical protein [Blastocatellia bacterium]
MRSSTLLLVALLLGSVQPGAAFAQSGEEFADPEGRFKITLHGDWKAITYSDAVGRQKTEFVYRDRRVGLLKISSTSLSGGSLSNIVREDEENQRTYRAGYVAGSNEDFGGGGLPGVRLAFYTTESYKQVANTTYYLRDGNRVWVLKFTGPKGTLDTMRNVTDQMARSFRPM